MLLALQTSELGHGSTLRPDARAAASEVSASLQIAIAELRDLVQGMMLTERGLGAAAEELADRCPIPVAVHLDEGRAALPDALETTGYFVVAEALANAVKHSQATAVELRMTQRDGHFLIDLLDDGVGGAHANGGAGLRNMSDRVEALGGHLTVRSPSGGGTRIAAEVPCAS